jgi:predicted enzyme related to lactoylglutathione lyase
MLAVILDANDAQRVARFWAGALGRKVVERNRGELMVGDPDSDGGAVLYVMEVPEPKAGKNRMHVDLLADRLDEEVERLTALGARLIAVRRDDDSLANPDVWAVLADPEGNEFCVTSRVTLTGWGSGPQN